MEHSRQLPLEIRLGHARFSRPLAVAGSADPSGAPHHVALFLVRPGVVEENPAALDAAEHDGVIAGTARRGATDTEIDDLERARVAAVRDERLAEGRGLLGSRAPGRRLRGPRRAEHLTMHLQLV